MNGPSSRTVARAAQTKISTASPFRLRVRRSGIHRLGVFAVQNIPPRRKVIEYTGERISRRETRRRFLEGSNGRSRRLNYLACVDSYWAIDGAVGGNGAELINHSCDPNLALRVIRKRLWLISLRRVRAGEELCYDYHFAKNGERVRCHCGSRKCRGTINNS
ncbi:MAG TPA: SET domain-containing protein-lysine N-methyltransferase [Candidatus Acidoferrum sp.]|nr:SET domain-containing protein-lysine N-methyltransferase [Candidatus Acidoferrum sp.]